MTVIPIILLIIIDVLSKYVWIKLRDKMDNCMIKAFQRVLAKSEGRIPVYLQADKGKEFVAQSMQKFLKEDDILFRVMCNPDVAIVERFNRRSKCGVTLGIKIHRATSHRCFSGYCTRLHTLYSSTRMQPAVLTRENARIAREKYS